MNTSNGKNREKATRIDPLGNIRELSGIEFTNDMMLLVDPEDDLILDVVTGADTFCGWTRDQLIRKTPRDILPEAFFKQVDNAGTDWRVNRFETSIPDRGNTQHDFEIFVIRLTETEKPLLAYICHNVEQQKRHHKELDRYFTVLNQVQKLAGIGFYERELATNKGFWSNGLYWIFGFVPGEVPPLQESFLKIVHPDDLIRVKAAIQKSLKEKEPSDVIHRIIIKDGTTRIVRAICTFIYDDQGNPTHHRGTFMDITVSRRLFEKVAASETKFRAIATHTEEILFQTDEKGVLTFIAGHGLDHLGYTSRDLVGRSAEDLFRHRPDEYSLVQKALAGQTVRGKIHFRSQILSLWFSPLRDRSETVIGLLGMAVNVTEENRIKKELENKENYLRSVYCNIHEDIYVINRNYIIQDVNRKFLLSNDLRREDVLGRPCFAISHGNDHPCDLEGEDCYLKQVFETGEPVNYRHIHKDHDGHERFVDIIMSPILDQSGKITEVIEATRDMTDLVMAERARKNREVEFSAVINTAKDAVIGIDSTGKISIWNQAAETMFGYSRKEVLGAVMHSIIAPGKYRNESQQGLRKFFETGKGKIIGQTVEITALKKDGTEFPIELSISGMNLEGKWHATAIIRDISERIQNQEKLKSALKKAKEGERIKSIFLENMSHEIRTPLNSIMGFTEILEEKLGDVLDSDSKEIFSIVRSSGKRLLRTVHEILDMSQLATQSFKTQPKLMSLEDTVRRTAFDLESEAKAKQLFLRLENLSGNTLVRIDPYSFDQALSNIIDNAIKYTETGGVTINMKKNNEHIVLSVADTGIGMSSQYVQQLFDPFTQESEGRTKKFQGIGLGMALSKKFLELNQITLKLETEKDQGTRVKLMIPYPSETGPIRSQ